MRNIEKVGDLMGCEYCGVSMFLELEGHNQTIECLKLSHDGMQVLVMTKPGYCIGLVS